MRHIRLNLGRARSDIVVGAGAFGSIRRLLADIDDDRGGFDRWLVVSQKPVIEAVGLGSLRSFPLEIIPNGERAKTLGTVRRLVDRMIDLGMTRQSGVIALGGGVVGDVTGFAGSVFLRGIRVVQVPTTLLAQVDSSVGGKTGVNHPRGKNLIGTFHQPSLVVADPRLVATLPGRDFRSGLYEVLKYGVIRDRVLFGHFERHGDKILGRDPELVEEIVHRSLAVKAAVVRADEREGGLRRILNFGHTIGHAIESAASYRRITHGEAVGYGMLGATRIASTLGMLAPAEAERVTRAVGSIGRLPSIRNLSVSAMLDAIGHDKKVRDGQVHFVLPTRIGTVETRAGVGQARVRETLQALVAMEAG